MTDSTDAEKAARGMGWPTAFFLSALLATLYFAGILKEVLIVIGALIGFLILGAVL